LFVFVSPGDTNALAIDRAMDDGNLATGVIILNFCYIVFIHTTSSSILKI